MKKFLLAAVFSALSVTAFAGETTETVWESGVAIVRSGTECNILQPKEGFDPNNGLKVIRAVRRACQRGDALMWVSDLPRILELAPFVCDMEQKGGKLPKTIELVQAYPHTLVCVAK